MFFSPMSKGEAHPPFINILKNTNGGLLPVNLWVLRSAPGRFATIRPCAGDSRGDDLAEQHPLLSIEALQLHLLDGRVVVRPGVDPNAGDENGQFQVLQVGRLSHEVLARKIITALLEDLYQGLRRGEIG